VQDFVSHLEKVSALVAQFPPSCAVADFQEASVSDAFHHVFTATCFSNVAVMGSLDVRPSVRPSVRLSVTLVIPDHIH